MKGLLLKDVCTMATEAKYTILLLIVMVCLHNSWLYTFAIVYASVLPVTSLGYDERAKWNKLADMLPYTVAQLVGSKYLLGYLASGIAALFAVFGRWTGIRGATSAEDFITIAIVFCIATIVEAIQLPLMFGIGVEKGRLLFVMLTVTAAGSMYAVTDLLEETALTGIGAAHIMILVVAAAVISNLISFWVSGKLYQRAK